MHSPGSVTENPGKSAPHRISANLTKGSLKPAESKLVAIAMLEGRSRRGLLEVVLSDNLLAKRNEVTTRTLVPYLEDRLSAAPPEIRQLVATGDAPQRTQACFLAALAAHPVLRGFVELALPLVRIERRPRLIPSDWSAYLAELESVDPSVANWKETTRRKLRQNVWRILFEVGALDATSTARLQSVVWDAEVLQVLESPGMAPTRALLADAGILWLGSLLS